MNPTPVTLFLFFFLLLSLLITGCVDNTSAIRHCESVGLQYTGKFLGCDIECINVTTAEKKVYAADCQFGGR